jgi:hypothetical protein
MRVPVRLTMVLAGLMAAQAVTGIAAPGEYRDAAWITATWFGNDWLTFAIAVPLLLAGLAGARRGSPRAFLLWAGCVGYAVYNYAFYLLGAALNVFFPLYVTALVLASVILIVSLGTREPSSIDFALRPVVPLRFLAGVFIAIGGGLAVVWIAIWAAYVFAGRPTPVDPEVFRLVAALDLSLMVPALVSGGVLLWQRRRWGTVLASIAGVQGSLYLAVLSLNSVIAIRRGLATAPGELVTWAPLFAVTVTVTALLLSSVRRAGHEPAARSPR